MENLSIKELLIKLFTDPVKLAVEKYKDHPSIMSIKNKTARIDNPKYSFSFVSLNETLDRINKLNPKKASQATDILVKITKGNKDLFNNVFQQRIIKLLLGSSPLYAPMCFYSKPPVP